MRRLFEFVKDAGEAFLPAYLPIVERRRDHTYNKDDREAQLTERERYVEFNLIVNLTTIFGAEMFL
jgi:coproporphyrinogen III oxidase